MITRRDIMLPLLLASSLAAPVYELYYAAPSPYDKKYWPFHLASKTYDESGNQLRERNLTSMFNGMGQLRIQPNNGKHVLFTAASNESNVPHT